MRLSRSRWPVMVALYVHQAFPTSLLVSRHGRSHPDGSAEGGIFIPVSQVSWPDRWQKQDFESWKVRERGFRGPGKFLFALPDWLVKREGLSDCAVRSAAQRDEAEARLL